MKQIFGAGRFVNALLFFLCIGIEVSVHAASEEAESTSSDVSPSGEISNVRTEEGQLSHAQRNSLTQEEAEKLFWHAAGSGYLKVVEHLVRERKVAINAADHEGRTALHHATEGGHVSVIRYLIKNGALINPIDKDDYTPLLKAAFSDQYEAFLELVGLGADPTVKLPKGSNVLHVAASCNSLPIVSYVIKWMPHILFLYQINAKGETPLHAAARGGHVILVIYFHQLDRRLMAQQDADGMTPLQAALEAKKHSAAQYLMNVAWNDLLRMQDSRGRTPLHTAAENGLSDLVSHLIEVRGVPVDYKNCCWETPLIFAARAGQLDVVKYLIAKGADPEHMDQDESTPLLNAALEGELDVVRYLVEHVRVDLTAENAGGGTALHCAAESGSLELVKYLIERCGIDVDTVNTRFETPLGWAALNNHLAIAAYLIARGACIEGQPSSHPLASTGCLSRPVYLAVSESAFDGVMHLLQIGAKLYRVDFEEAAIKGSIAQLIRELIGPMTKGDIDAQAFFDFMRLQVQKAEFLDWLKSAEGPLCALLYKLLVPQLDAALHVSGVPHAQLMAVGAATRHVLRDIQKRMQKRVPRDVSGIILCDFSCFPKTIFQVPVQEQASVEEIEGLVRRHVPRNVARVLSDFLTVPHQGQDRTSGDVVEVETLLNATGRKRGRIDYDQEEREILGGDAGVEGGVDSGPGQCYEGAAENDDVSGEARVSKRQRRGDRQHKQ